VRDSVTEAPSSGRTRRSASLEEDFVGAGMRGHLAYEFVPDGRGTILIQRETVVLHGLLRPFAGWIERSLGAKLRARLDSIRTTLDSGWAVNHS
jgi:hypothetical protein